MNKTFPEELRKLAAQLRSVAQKADESNISAELSAIISAASRVAESWSGSNLGYQAKVYYKDLAPPPAGASFNMEWGLYPALAGASRGEWVEYDDQAIKDIVMESAGNPDLGPAHELAAKARGAFNDAKSAAMSILSVARNQATDDYLNGMTTKIDGLKVATETNLAQGLLPQGYVMYRDPRVSGLMLAPHQVLMVRVATIRGALERCSELSALCDQIAAHLERSTSSLMANRETPARVFIGHGRSPLWRELKDLITEGLGLEYDEFNRAPVAGITNIARLEQMLGEATIAFLILTAEDEQADTSFHARMNVIHEAGLFQGKLGFTRAIVMLEEGCEAFSNIDGLGQIRFARGNIRSAFHDVREVLEREQIIPTN